MNVLLRKAEMADCRQIHAMQVEAFAALFEKYKDHKTNPAAEPLERIRQRMAQDFTDYYFICLGQQAIGAIRIVKMQNDTCRISPMFILPQYQGNGYAQQAIVAAEALYPHGKRWMLDTIKQEEKLCHLYEKMGYQATGKEEDIQDGMTIVYYEK